MGPVLAQAVLSTGVQPAMYGLRACGGNHFSYYGGGRSDFVVLQHLEFNLGRIGCENGVGGRWDTSRSAHKRAKSLVRDKLLASPIRNTEARCCPPTRGTLKQRALSRTSSAPTLGFNRSIGSEDSLEGFLEELRSPQSLPSFSREPSDSSVTRHFREIRGQLSSLQQRQIRDPEGLRDNLAKGETWKYWAHALKDIRQRRVWGEDAPDDSQLRGLSKQKGVGRWNYVYPSA